MSCPTCGTFARLASTPTLATARLAAEASASASRAFRELLSLAPQLVVSLTDGLETRGLVARRTNPGRRRTLVELTPRGKKALARADEATARIEAEVLGDLDQSERRLLHEMLCRALGSHAERRED